MKKILLSIVVGGLSVLMVQAQTNMKNSATHLNTRDKGFVTEAAQGGIAEVQLGQLAENKASEPAVKDFANKMVTDHSKVNDELKETASKIGVTLPTDMGSQYQAEKTKLAELSGMAFDRAYMRDMVKNHRADVAAFRREARWGHNEQVKMFASQTLPKLREHLRLADSTYAKIGGSKAS